MAGEMMKRRSAMMAAVLRGTALVLVAQAAGLSLAPAAVAQTADGVTIAGNRRIEEATIRTYLGLQPGEARDPAKVNEGVKRLYATGLFSKIDVAPTANGIVLTVVENPIINEIAIEGNLRLDDDVLMPELNVRPRTAFTRARVEADAQRLIEVYRRAGRYAATVEPKIIELPDNRVNLVFEVNEGPLTGIESIKFVGNTAFSDARLAGAIETSESAWWRILSTTDSFDPDRLEYDKELLRRYYLNRGYMDFEVLSAVAELNPERTGFIITFTVSEGQPYKVSRVSMRGGAPGVDPAIFEPFIKIGVGDEYNIGLIEDSIEDMNAHAGLEGLTFVDIKPVTKKNPADHTVELAFEISEGQRVYVDRIDIEGNVRTLDRVIRREFDLVEGDAFNPIALNQARQRLRALGYFGKVTVTPERGGAADRVTIKTKVEETSTGELSFGVGISSSENVGGEINLTERNFLGRGQLARFRVSATKKRQMYDFRFMEPRIMDRNLGAGFDLYRIESDLRDESSFETINTGFRPRVEFPLDRHSKVELRYQISKDEITAVPEDASPLVAKDIGSRNTNLIGMTYTYDRRDDKIEPTRGFISKLSLEAAGLLGDSEFLRAEASTKFHRPIYGERVIGSVEFAGGGFFPFGNNDDVITDRFFIGGDSLRGFKNSGVGPRDRFTYVDSGGTTRSVNDALGGNFYAVMRNEITFPLGLPEEYGFYGGFFVDVGTVWDLNDTSYTIDLDGPGPGGLTTRVIDDGIKFRASGGFSLFWASPLGPMRFNFGLPIVKQSGDETEFFRFTAGTRF